MAIQCQELEKMNRDNIETKDLGKIQETSEDRSKNKSHDLVTDPLLHLPSGLVDQ